MKKDTPQRRQTRNPSLNENSNGLPRRSRMPKAVYETANNARTRLENCDSPIYTEPTDETLCDEIAQPLRNLVSLLYDVPGIRHDFFEGMEHICAEPWTVQHYTTEAMRLAYGIDDLIKADEKVSNAERQRCAELFDYFEQIRKCVDASTARWVKRIREPESRPVAGNKKGKSTKQDKRSDHTAGFDWSYFGVHRGDTLTVEENGEASIEIGRLIYLKDGRENQPSYFHRVCEIKGDMVRVASDIGEAHDEPRNLAIGHVVEIKHENCAATKINKLRSRLAELQDDDEHTLSLTRCYEVEKQIFDLEHPLEMKEETETSDEWPEVIGEGSE